MADFIVGDRVKITSSSRKGTVIQTMHEGLEIGINLDGEPNCTTWIGYRELELMSKKPEIEVDKYYSAFGSSTTFRVKVLWFDDRSVLTQREFNPYERYLYKRESFDAEFKVTPNYVWKVRFRRNEPNAVWLDYLTFDKELNARTAAKHLLDLKYYPETYKEKVG